VPIIAVTALEVPGSRDPQAAACGEGLFPSQQETRWPHPHQTARLEVPYTPYKAKQSSWSTCPNISAVAASETEGKVSRSDAKWSRSIRPLGYLQVEEPFYGKNQGGFPKHL